MKRLKTFITLTTLAFSLIISNLSEAQSIKVKDSAVNVSMIHVQGSYLIPAKDMSTRFGNCMSIGGGFLQKTKRNILWGAEINFISGNDIKEKYIFDSLKTVRGQYITNEGRYGDVRNFERGFSAYAQVGKIFPVFGSNKNSGIMLLYGVGFLQHKIHIEVLEENVPALYSEYRKGYDRLTNGLAIQEFIGYFYLNNRLRFNAYAGIEFNQAFTQNRRDWDFYAQRKLDESRKDYLNGFKVGIVLPLYQRKPKEFYYR